MNLSARKKQTATPQKRDETPDIGTLKQQDESTNGKYTHSISIRCHAMLYNTLQNMIVSAHTGGDFRYVSVADWIRAALTAYKDGMQLTELEHKGQKIATTIRVDNELFDFYQRLPDRLKSRLIERAIRSFLKMESVGN